MTSKPFPVPNSITPFWRSEPDRLDNHRSTKTLPETSDVVIVGAGYAGASTAYYLLEQADLSSKLSIVILEARQPDAYNAVGTVAEKYGMDAAIELAAFETAHLAAIEELVKRENITCDLQISLAHDVQLDETHDAKLKKVYDALITAGSAPTKTAVHTTGEEAEEVSGVKDAKGCFSYPAGRLWPYKLIVGLLETVIARGANLQANTPVNSISESDTEG